MKVDHFFKTISGQDIPYQIVPRREGDLATVYANADLAHQLLGWQATRDLHTMIEDTWRWQSKNPEGF